MFDGAVVVVLGVVWVVASLGAGGGGGEVGAVWGLTWGGVGAVVVAGWIGSWWFRRGGRSRGRSRGRGLVKGRAWLRLCRAGLVGWFGWCVFECGWVWAASEVVGGDVVLLDEVVAVLPGVLGVVALYGAAWEVERAWGSAVGGAAGSRWAFVVDRVRHRAGLVLVAVGLVVLWTEGLGWLLSGLGDRASVAALGVVGQVVGLVLLAVMVPRLVGWVWRTEEVGAGGLRGRLERVCEVAGVRVSSIRVWKPMAPVVNGAMVGVVPWTRSILLTRGLLGTMPGDEVEAVMAHEAGHARLHHLPWLMAGVIGAYGVGWLVFGAIGRVVLELALVAGVGVEVLEDVFVVVDVGVAVLAAAPALLVFGMMSRTFERQADAFSGRVMGALIEERRRAAEAERARGLGGGGGWSWMGSWVGAGVNRAVERVADWASLGGGLSEPVDARDAGAAVMARALGRVAALNGVPAERFGFRHGSIGVRIERLRGGEMNAVVADERAGAAKRWALVLFVVGMAGQLASVVWGVPL